MDKQSFTKVVDESLHALRRKLLDAYAEGTHTVGSPAESGTNSQQVQQLNSSRISQRDPGGVSPSGSSLKNLPVVVTC